MLNSHICVQEVIEKNFSKENLTRSSFYMFKWYR